MKAALSTELIREDRFVAEVEVVLLDTGSGWSPYYGFDDMAKIDAVRLALRCGDLAAASKLARVFELTPVAAESSAPETHPVKSRHR
ncbi:MAG: hypothetical protein SH859_06350 [Hyphomicrobium aestuarii]|nr:hypothetical protein [Hyphomicrobium aestuarii]